MLDDRDHNSYEDPYSCLATAFNNYTDFNYSNYTYFINEVNEKKNNVGCTNAFKECGEWNPSNNSRPLRDAVEIKQHFANLKTPVNKAYRLFQTKTGEGGNGDLEGYFWSKCYGDRKVLYAYHLWKPLDIQRLGKSLGKTSSAESGVIGIPNTEVLSTPRKKTSRKGTDIFDENPEADNDVTSIITSCLSAFDEHEKKQASNDSENVVNVIKYLKDSTEDKNLAAGIEKSMMNAIIKAKRQKIAVYDAIHEDISDFFSQYSERPEVE